MHAIRQYLWHWLTAVNQHSLHSPFVYDLYTQVINRQPDYKPFEDIEQLRQRLVASPATIEVTALGAISKVSNKKERPLAAIARKGISNQKISHLLYRLARYYNCRHVIELGTSLGLNAMYLASIPKSYVATFEGCPQTAALARQHFAGLHYTNIHLVEGNIDNTLPDYLSKAGQPVDLVFVDANHRYAPTLAYFEALLTHSHAHSILVFDDIHWSAEMSQAWQTICRHPQVQLSIDLYRLGLVFLNPAIGGGHYRLMF